MRRNTSLLTVCVPLFVAPCDMLNTGGSRHVMSSKYFLRSVVIFCTNLAVPYIRGVHIFKKSIRNLIIIGARKLTWRKSQTDDPQILGVAVKSVVATASWLPAYVHPYTRDTLLSRIPFGFRALYSGPFLIFYSQCVSPSVISVSSSCCTDENCVEVAETCSCDM